MGWVFTEEMRFYLHEHETLLEGMLRTQHQKARYECRQGYCGACRMKVVQSRGQISYKYPTIAHLEDDEILACCCLVEGMIKVRYPSS